MADCVVSLALEGDEFSGNMLIDDEYLESRGATKEDIARYRMDPDFEPPRILAEPSSWSASFKRGDVKKLKEDLSKSKL